MTPHRTFRLHRIMTATGLLLLIIAGATSAIIYAIRSEDTLFEARNGTFSPAIGEAHARIDTLSLQRR